jgi:amidase
MDSEVPPLAWCPAPRVALPDLRIAWTASFPGTRIATEIRAAIEAFAHELERCGARVKQCLPEVDLVQQAQLLIRLTELIEAAFATPPTALGEYFTALDERDMVIAQWERFFDTWDVLVCPAAEITAARLTETVLLVDGEEIAPGSGVAPHQLSPATGQPAIVIPLANDRNGLPIGVQVIGRRWDDERLLAIAERFSEVTGGFQRPPGY